MLKYREDGWPLCPNCGEDELYSRFNWNGEGERPPIQEWIDAGLACYNCAWTNVKPLPLSFYQRPVSVNTGVVIKGDKIFKEAMRDLKIEISFSLIRLWSIRIGLGLTIVRLGIWISGLKVDWRGVESEDVLR